MNGTQTEPTLSGNAPILMDALDYSPLTVVLVLIAFVGLFYTSTRIVEKALDHAGVEPPSNDQNHHADSTAVRSPDDQATAESTDETTTETDGGTTDVDEATDPETTEEDTGTVIGKAENVLVLSLMLLEAYTALGVIFAAKSIVRKSDMDQQDTSYYLTGTLTNFTYSVVVGLLLHVLLWGIVKFDLFG